MYYYEEYQHEWKVFDPDGEELAVVHYEEEAAALVSHLNKGM